MNNEPVYIRFNFSYYSKRYIFVDSQGGVDALFFNGVNYVDRHEHLRQLINEMYVFRMHKPLDVIHSVKKRKHKVSIQVPISPKIYILEQKY